jgi:methionine-rich copper-binding protein CopC
VVVAAAAAAVAVACTPATAASISAAVASFTMRFCEKIQPSGSFWSSQVLPFPVVSEV